MWSQNFIQLILKDAKKQLLLKEYGDTLSQLDYEKLGDKLSNPARSASSASSGSFFGISIGFQF